MRFLRAAAAGVTAGALLGVLLVVSGVGWDIPEPMRRERFFVAALNALLCGWAGAALTALWPRVLRRPLADPVSAAFWAAAALALAPWSWFAVLPAVLLLRLALRDGLPRVLPGTSAAGALLHLAPAALFLLYPAETRPLGFTDQPEPLGPGAAGAPQVSAERPDVLYLVCDTLRADALEDAATPTPNLSALLARGTSAPFALAPCNQTLPSHMVMFTGLDIEKLGMRSNESRWPTAQGLRSEWRVQTVAERLHAAGWRTAGVAANILLTSAPSVDDRPEEAKEQSFRAGFEWWHGMQRVEYFKAFVKWSGRRTLLGWLLPERGVSWPLLHLLNPNVHDLMRTHWKEGERTADLALQALAQLHAQPQPGFLFVNFFDPHAPYNAPPPFGGSIAGAAPPGYPDGLAGEFDMRVAMYDAFQAERAPGFRGVPREVGAEAANLHDRYREEVAYADAMIGRLLQAVEASGRPTLILFVGDHGEAFGEHRNAEHRWTLHEEELRVPFILAGPGVPAGRRLRQTPELVDGTRTLLELLGMADASVCGRNVLTTDDEPPRPPLSMMVYRATMRDERYKLIAWISYGEDKNPQDAFQPGAYELRPLQLFDLQADPGERDNLLRDGAILPDAAKRALETLLESLRARMRDDRFPLLPVRQLNSKQEDQLHQLGYA